MFTAKHKAWLMAMRLHTLPLSFSGIIVGGALAYRQGYFSHPIFILSILTATTLQVLSNFANDYGDGIKGTDNHRIGPERAIQKGLISIPKMKKGITITILFIIIEIILLLSFSFGIMHLSYFVIFLLLGGASILAAVYYTVGKKPYGYIGLGDIFVFIFFGLLSICGSYFLYSKSLPNMCFLPATSFGLLSVAVLNLNNMRDIETDKKSGKNTLSVALGFHNAKLYHYNIVLLSMILLMLFSILTFQYHLKQLLYITIYPFLIAHLLRIKKIKNPIDFNPELKKVSLITLFLSILFSLGLLL